MVLVHRARKAFRDFTRVVMVAALLALLHGGEIRAEGGPAAQPAPPAPAPPTPPAPPADDQGAAEAEGDVYPPLEFPEDGLIVRDDGDVLYFYRTNFVEPAELQVSLTTLLEVPGVSLKPFPRQNVLLIQGDPDAVELALEAAAYFDVSAPQVFIEAKVIEITYETNFEFGLDYIWSRAEVGPGSIWQGADAVLSPPSYIRSQLPGGLPFQGTSLLFGFLGKNAERFGLADLALRAMELEGRAEVLSKPSIVCTQNIPAEVSTSEARQLQIFDRADRNNEHYKGSILNTGVTLKVLAKHVGEAFVTMDIEPQVQGVQGLSATTGGTLLPVQTTRKAKTTVTLGDGETLVIGGLYTNRSITDKAKTPLVSDIPLLGCLFTRTQESKVKTELVFLLTPTIIRKTSDFKVIAPPAELERLEGAEDAAPDPCPCPTPAGAGGGPPTVRSTPLAR